ncbi:UDP-glucose 6-dehydrogenase 3-like [Chenopodium quinoa]|nr:UDP-glucose 6-dehydrogenase 3-like [Chenopodium quinoa]XP_021746100.1 UDP-glucose 6-dehydrogenase 3-like [Chenopodium quinoa]
MDDSSDHDQDFSDDVGNPNGDSSDRNQDHSNDVGNPGGSPNDENVTPPPELEDIERICCIGGGRVGVLTMMVLAHYWHIHKHFVLDKDVERINDMNGINAANERVMPFSELDMDLYLNKGIDRGNLHFSSNIDHELDLCQMVFIAVDIPLKMKPKVLKNDLDINNFEDAIKSILQSIDRIPGWKCVAIKSTVPVDYKSNIANHIHGFYDAWRLSVITNPEFFSVGTAVQDLLHPQKVVLGDFYEGQNSLALFRDLYAGVVNVDNIEIIGSQSSVQIGKLLSNAVLAAQLTLMNIGSTLCEKVGSNFDDVRSTITANSRLNQVFTNSRPGYGGMGLTKDIDYLAYLCEYVGMTFEKKFFTMISEMRRRKMDELVQNVSHMIAASKSIAIYGFSNKVDSDDIRESPAIYICRSLLKINGIRLKIFDPLVSDNTILKCFVPRERNRILVVDNIGGAFDVEAMVFLVEWPMFATMLEEQRDELVNTMRRPSFIFDCCDLIVDVDGFDHIQIYRLGKPKLSAI